jgi:hypothetical protein
MLNELLKHILPLSWEHINRTGIYSWNANFRRPSAV